MKSKRKICFFILPAIVAIIGIVICIMLVIYGQGPFALLFLLGIVAGTCVLPSIIYSALCERYINKIVKKIKKEQGYKERPDIPNEESNLYFLKLDIHVNPLLQDKGALMRLSGDNLKKHVKGEYEESIRKNYSNISFEAPEVSDILIPLYNLIGEKYCHSSSIKWAISSIVSSFPVKELISTNFYFLGELSVGNSKKPCCYFVYIESSERSRALIYIKAINKMGISVYFYGGNNNDDNEAKNIFTKLLELSGKEEFCGLIDAINSEKDIDINSLQKTFISTKKDKNTDDLNDISLPKLIQIAVGKSPNPAYGAKTLDEIDTAGIKNRDEINEHSKNNLLFPVEKCIAKEVFDHYVSNKSIIKETNNLDSCVWEFARDVTNATTCSEYQIFHYAIDSNSQTNLIFLLLPNSNKLNGVLFGKCTDGDYLYAYMTYEEVNYFDLKIKQNVE